MPKFFKMPKFLMVFLVSLVLTTGCDRTLRINTIKVKYPKYFYIDFVDPTMGLHQFKSNLRGKTRDVEFHLIDLRRGGPKKIETGYRHATAYELYHYTKRFPKLKSRCFIIAYGQYAYDDYANMVYPSNACKESWCLMRHGHNPTYRKCSGMLTVKEK